MRIVNVNLSFLAVVNFFVMLCWDDIPHNLFCFIPNLEQAQYIQDVSYLFVRLQKRSDATFSCWWQLETGQGQKLGCQRVGSIWPCISYLILSLVTLSPQIIGSLFTNCSQNWHSIFCLLTFSFIASNYNSLSSIRQWFRSCRCIERKQITLRVDNAMRLMMINNFNPKKYLRVVWICLYTWYFNGNTVCWTVSSDV